MNRFDSNTQTLKHSKTQKLNNAGFCRVVESRRPRRGRSNPKERELTAPVLSHNCNAVANARQRRKGVVKQNGQNRQNKLKRVRRANRVLRGVQGSARECKGVSSCPPRGGLQGGGEVSSCFKLANVTNLKQLEFQPREKNAALSSRTRTAAHTREGSQGVGTGRAANPPRKCQAKDPLQGVQGGVYSISMRTLYDCSVGGGFTGVVSAAASANI